MENPKPARNWRGYFKEYAVIVIGVLTALAAEQAVTWANWRSEVGAARTALRAEMTDNNSNFFARRVAIAPCLDRQMAKVEAAIAILEAGGSPAAVDIRPASNSLISDSEWQSHRASQVLTHFPRAELAAMGRYYASVSGVAPWLATESMAWQELSILQKVPRGITPSDVIRLRVNLAAAERAGYLIGLMSRRVINISIQLGMPEAKADPLRVKYFCGSLNAQEYQRWLKSLMEQR